MKIFLADLDASHESEHVYQGRYSDRGVEDKQNTLAVFIQFASTRYQRDLLYMSTQVSQPGLKVFRRKRANTTRAIVCSPITTRISSKISMDGQRHCTLDNRSAQHFAMWDYWPRGKGIESQSKEIRLKRRFNQSRNYENLRLSRLVL